MEKQVPMAVSVHAAWSRPPVGACKLNIDGAYVASSGLAGYGMILWRSDGSVIFSACRALRFCSSALDAELHTSLEGIKLALELCQEDIQVETLSSCEWLHVV
jgi:ribonuclease HI